MRIKKKAEITDLIQKVLEQISAMKPSEYTALINTDLEMLKDLPLGDPARSYFLRQIAGLRTERTLQAISLDPFQPEIACIVKWTSGHGFKTSREIRDLFECPLTICSGGGSDGIGYFDLKELWADPAKFDEFVEFINAYSGQLDNRLIAKEHLGDINHIFP